MKKITVKISDELAAEFNAAVKRRQTTQKKALEIMLKDWLMPKMEVRKLADELPDYGPGVMQRMFGWRGRS